MLTKPRSLTLLLMCVLLLSNCSNEAPVNADTPSGPLKILSVDGELSADGPHEVNGSWTETYSGVVMCAEAPITVNAVNYAGPTDPLEVYATLHWISHRKGKPTSSSILSLRGSPTSNDSDWTTLGGHFERVTDSGVTVKSNCSTGAQIELMTTMRVSKYGGDISSINLEYTSGDQDYTLPIPYRYVACGSAITDKKRYC